MNIFILLVAVPLVVGLQLPAAVVEDIQEIDLPESLNLNLEAVNKKMMRFIDQTRTETSPDQITMDTYIKAYQISHEKYQDSEEKLNAAITKQNLEDIRNQRFKRSLPSNVQMVKFELEDAKNPDTETIENQKQKRESRNLRSPYEVSEHISNIRNGKLYPGHDLPLKRNGYQETNPFLYLSRTNRPMHSASEFPLAVQKAIDIVLNEHIKIPPPIELDKLRFGSTKLYNGYENLRYGSMGIPAESNKIYFGDKIPKTTEFQKIETTTVKPQQNETQAKYVWLNQDASRTKRLHVRPNNLNVVPLMVKPQYLTSFLPTPSDLKSLPSHGAPIHIVQPNFIHIDPKYNNYLIKDPPSFPHQYMPKSLPYFHPTYQQSIDKFKQMVHATYNSNPYGPVELHILANQEKAAPQQQQQEPLQQQLNQQQQLHQQQQQQQQQQQHQQQQQQHQLQQQQQQQQLEQQQQQQQHHPQQPQTQFIPLNNNIALQHQLKNQPYQKPQAQRFGHQFPDSVYANDGPSIAALSALIGKTPSAQLRGLSDLLRVEQTSKEPRPQDSTSPILFHPENPQGNKGPTPRPVYAYSVAGATKQIIPIIDDINYESSTPTYDNRNKYYTANAQFSSANDRSESISTIEKPLKLHLISERLPEAQPLVQQEPLNPEISHSNYEEQHETPSQKYHTIAPAQLSETDEEHLEENGHYGDRQDLQYASKYAFGYRVRDFHTGNDFGHTQHRSMDGVTRGEYHILLPDGRVQVVKYKADEDGFKADVTYEEAN